MKTDGISYSADKQVIPVSTNFGIVPIYESKVGSLVKIKCNPQNPTEIADTYSFNAKVSMAVIAGIMDSILLADIYLKYRKEKEYKNLNSNPLEIDINKGL